ncbi:MAG: hypothetical protein WAU88_07145 [Candidatus Zixiibacteriota bacterium]
MTWIVEPEKNAGGTTTTSVWWVCGPWLAGAVWFVINQAVNEWHDRGCDNYCSVYST